MLSAREARAKRLGAVALGAGLLVFLAATFVYLDHRLAPRHAHDRATPTAALSAIPDTKSDVGSAASSPSVPAKAPPVAARTSLDRLDATDPPVREPVKQPRRSTSQPVPQASSKRHAVAAPAPSQRPQTASAERSLAQSPPAGAYGASVASPVVVEEPRRVSRERLALHTGSMERLRKEQQEQCTQTSFIPRELCKERLRWTHCHPNRWDQVPECRVHRSEFAP
jgi:hypothetical protein